MSEIIQNAQENIETERKPISRVFIIRHGKSGYKEYQGLAPEEVEDDLLPKGREQIEELSNSLTLDLDKDSHVRIITSPAIRALGSAKILNDNLLKSGFEVDFDQNNPSESFGSTKIYGSVAEIIGGLYKEHGDQLSKDWFQLWKTGRFDESKIESFNALLKRVRESFVKGIKILRKSDSTHRDLSQTILITHGEVIEALFKAFDLGDPNNGQEIGNGEKVEIQVFPNEVVISHNGQDHHLNI